MNDRSVLETYYDLDKEFDIEVETTITDDGQKLMKISAYKGATLVFESTALYQHTYFYEEDEDEDQ